MLCFRFRIKRRAVPNPQWKGYPFPDWWEPFPIPAFNRSKKIAYVPSQSLQDLEEGIFKSLVNPVQCRTLGGIFSYFPVYRSYFVVVILISNILWRSQSYELCKQILLLNYSLRVWFKKHQNSQGYLYVFYQCGIFSNRPCDLVNHVNY